MKTLLLMLLTITSLLTFGQKKTFVFFKTGESSISANYKQRLDSLVRELTGKEYEVQLSGHTDSIGSINSNNILSGNRVNSVANYLQNKGILKSNISSKYFGETNPLFSESSESQRAKNRCVEIIVIYKTIKTTAQTSPANSDSGKVVIKVFENDTTLYFANGTIIEFEAETFFPHKIKDIQLNVTEIFTTCDMLNNNTVTRSTNGDCLTSAGMLYISPTFEGIDIQPNLGKVVKIKIPIVNGIYDKSMTLYAGVKDTTTNELVWKEIEATVTYENNGSLFYLFKVDTLGAFNLDKKIGVICKKNGPKIKIPKMRNALICQTYPDEAYLAVAEKIDERNFVLDKIIEEKKPIVTIVAYNKKGIPYMAKGPLFELKFRKGSQTFIVNKNYFFAIPGEYDETKGLKEYMCNYLSN